MVMVVVVVEEVARGHSGEEAEAIMLKMTVEELRSDPAYISYYYSNVNLNPRLLHPLLSKEDWRFAQKLQRKGGGSLAFRGIRDTRKVNRGVDIVKPHGSAEWGGDGLIGLPRLGIGSRKKSIAKVIQNV
ncbi:hypothetical protein LguiA_031989 [Lonicera macranthoides]